MASLPHLTCAQLRELDRVAVEELGLPSIVLMENAGRGAAEAILAEFSGPRRALDAAIFCGAGNNGGDGYVVARHLHNAGSSVLVVEASERRSPDAAVFRAVTVAMGLEHVSVSDVTALVALRPRIATARVLVDALLGTGARGEPRGFLAELIGELNELAAVDGGPMLVALDVPSGLDADTGAPSRWTIRAARTLTFAAPKLGFRVPRAQDFLGRVTVCSIGTPPALLEAVRVMP